MCKILRHTADRFDFVITALSDQGFGACELLVRYSEFFDAFYFGQNTNLCLQRLRCLKIDFKEPKILESLQVGRTTCDQAFLVTNILVQNRGASFAQNRSEDFEPAGVIGQKARGVKAERYVILLNRTELPAISHSSLLRLGGSVVSLDRLSIVGNVAVKLHDFSDGFFDVEPAGNRENNVGWPIVLLDISNDVVSCEGPQTFRCTDAPAPHPMLLEGSGIDFFRGNSAGIIQLSIVLLQDDFDFAFQFCRVIH